MGSGRYANCNVAGERILFIKNNKSSEKFIITDMSADRIRLETSAILKEEADVKLKIRLKGSPVEVHLDLNGKVKSRLEKGYEIEIVDLSDYDREEIDELMSNTCNI